MDFTSDDVEPETLLRAFGCALMSLMPDSGLDDAVQAVCDALQFALDDASLLPVAPTETIRTGIAAHMLPVVEWDRP